MVKQQRHAVFNLVVALVALAGFVILIPLLGVYRAQAGFALLSLLALGPLFMLRRRGEVIWDERDRFIFHRANQITFGLLWLLFVAGAMWVYYAHRSSGVISIEVLTLSIGLGVAALMVCQSTMLLILYRRY